MSEKKFTEYKIEKLQVAIKVLQNKERQALKELGEIRREQDKLMSEIVEAWEVVRGKTYNQKCEG